MKRARCAAYWIAPSLFCIVLYWQGLHSWFYADDFAWLKLGSRVNDWSSFLAATFTPKAQGTIRPWSERLFFMGLYAVFGLNPIPFRVCVFLTQAANLVLLTSITNRLTGSRAAGLCAALLWVVNSSLALALGWTCLYNQVLCAFFLLLAFHYLLRYVETGSRRYEVLQWLVFLAGFGALEVNAIYPALVAGYTSLCARKYFRRALLLFVPSIAYVVVHHVAAPMPQSGPYAAHLDWTIFKTMLTYWSWSVGSVHLRSPLGMPAWLIRFEIVLVSALLLALAKRIRLAAFFLCWFWITLLPVLPLRDHVSEYYAFIPTIGLAMAGGWGLVRAWRHGRAYRAVAGLGAALYLAVSLPQAYAMSDWLYWRSLRVKSLLLSVARARALHPEHTIVLDGVDEHLFLSGILNRPFALVGVGEVYLTPENAKSIEAKPDWGDPREYALPEGVMARALERGEVTVYRVEDWRLRNITTGYTVTFQARSDSRLPRRVEPGNPVMAYLLGPTWYQADENHRWMPRRATVRIGGPTSSSQKLYLKAGCAPSQTRDGAMAISITAQGIPLPRMQVAPGRTEFDFAVPLPGALVGKESIELTIEVEKTARPSWDRRELGLVFGILEVR